MPRYELDLRLDAPADDHLASALTEESERLRSAIYRKLGLKVRSRSWVTIDPGSDKGRRTIRQLVAECASGAVVAGAGSLTEHLEQAEVDAADWFCLVTKTADDSFSLWDDYPSYKAGRHPAGSHALNGTFVSAAFVAACERAGLRGISFLRCRNRGRKPAPPWFVALPARSLGHGLDHPWFERAAWLRDVADTPAKRSSSLDTGQWSFHQRWLRDGPAEDAGLLASVLRLFPAPTAHDTTLTGLRIETVPRYWSKAFPDADFAYVPWGEDGPNREGKLMRFRLLMVGRRARQSLIDAGLFAAKAFTAVRSVAEPEEGVAPLDEQFGPVPPMYTDAELAALRAREGSLPA